MSARDAESGSSTYKGGSGRAGGLGNGGIGGGMGGGGNWGGGGGMGGGAGRNGGIGNRTGLSTGTTWHGNAAFGRPGGMASGYGMMRNGQMTNMRNLDGTPMFVGPLSGNKPRARPAGAPPVAVENILAIEDVPPPAAPFQDIYGYAWKPPKDFWAVTAPSPWPGQGVTPQGPDPLANDMTRFNDPAGDPLAIAGIQGGMGAPGYVSDDARGFGGYANRSGGYSGGGWGGRGGGGW